MGRLRLSPATFWRMSLPEWRATLAGRMPRTTAPLPRADFEDLMKRYPDS